MLKRWSWGTLRATLFLAFGAGLVPGCGGGGSGGGTACKSDNDCKGDRVCVVDECVSPAVVPGTGGTAGGSAMLGGSGGVPLATGGSGGSPVAGNGVGGTGGSAASAGGSAAGAGGSASGGSTAGAGGSAGAGGAGGSAGGTGGSAGAGGAGGTPPECTGNGQCVNPPPCHSAAGAACIGMKCRYPAANDGVACNGGLCCTGQCIAGAQCCGDSDCKTAPECKTSAGATCSGNACTYPDASEAMACNGGLCCGGACRSGANCCTATECTTPGTCEKDVGASCLANFTCRYLADDGASCNGGLCCNRQCRAGIACCTAADCASVNTCQTGVQCLTGQCSYTNKTNGVSCGGATDVCCTGQCTDSKLDKFNCGSCGNTCYGGVLAATCAESKCRALVAVSGGGGELGQMEVDGTNVYWSIKNAALQAPKNVLNNPNPLTIATWTTGCTSEDSAIDATHYYYVTNTSCTNLDAASVLARVPIEGGTIGTLVSSVLVTALVVDATDVYFMGHYNNVDGMFRVAKTGGAVSTVASGVGVSPNYTHLVADATNLYWTGNSGISRGVFTVPKAGGIPALLASEASWSAVPMLGSSTVYYFAPGTACGGSGPLRSVPKTGGAPPVTIVPSLELDSCTRGFLDSNTFYWLGGAVWAMPLGSVMPRVVVPSGAAPPYRFKVDATDVYWLTGRDDGNPGLRIFKSPR